MIHKTALSLNLPPALLLSFVCVFQLQDLDSYETVPSAEATQRRQYLALQLRNFVAFQAAKESAGADDRTRSMQATVRQVLLGM